MEQIGAFAVPVVIVAIVILGIIKRVPVFEVFQTGAKEGMFTVFSIAPSLIGLIVAVKMLETSGFFELLSGWLMPVCSRIGMPPEVLSMGLLRPVSGSGSFALLGSLMETYGADSTIGKIASVMAGSTETTFYAVTVYYGSVGLKKTAHTLPAALLADLVSVLLAVVVVNWLG